MNNITDERLAFYLSHQKLIDEWARLSKLVPPTAHNFLCSLQAEIQSLAELLPGIKLHQNLDSDYPKLFLYSPTWAKGENVRVAIGLEWVRSSVGFAKQNKTTYIGVWVDQFQPGGPELSSKLHDVFKKAGLLAGELNSMSWWPARRFEGPSYPNFWENLDPYRKQLLRSIQEMWETFSSHVNQAVT